MLNLGPVSREWLHRAGIRSAGEIRKLGAVEVYRRVKRVAGANPSLNLLYALEGAITDTPWSLVPQKRRDELRRELEGNA